MSDGDTGPRLVSPDPLHRLRENEAVVELTVHSLDAWLSCRDGVVFGCPVCKKRGTTRDGGKPVALDTRAAGSASGVRGLHARVWQEMECMVCHSDLTVVLLYQQDGYPGATA